MHESTITISVTEYRALQLDAEAWRMLNRSPHVAELLGEWIGWVTRRDASLSSSAIAAAADWRRIANAPTYRELERRRSTFEHEPLTPLQIRRQAVASWAEFEGRAAA